MNEKKENFSAKTEIKADFNKIITKLINESPDRLKVLFDGEIKNNLIQPLFKKINESIDKSSITPQTIDFKLQDIIDDAVTNLLYDTKFANDIKDLYSSSFTDIFKSFKDIDPKSFHKQFVDQFNKKIEKSVEDLAVFKADIKLSDINIFERDKISSDKFKSLTNKILDQIEQHTDKISISNVGIAQDNLFESLFSVSPALNKSNKRKYATLVDKALDQITKTVDNIKIGDKGINQNTLFNVMFNDAPEMGFISRWKFNSLRETTLDILDKAVMSLKDSRGIKIEDTSLSASYLFNLLFNDAESGGFLWKWKFNSLKEEVIDILRKEVGKLEDGFNIQNTEPITTSHLLKLLFEDTDAGGFLWKRKYNSLREKVLEDLQEKVDGKFNITGDPLSTQDLIQLLFSDTPEIDTGFFGLLGPNIKKQINELRENVLNKISSSLGLDSSDKSKRLATEDEDAKRDKDERDHINRTVNIHEDSLKAIDKSFLESLCNADLVRETTQNKRFNQLMSFLKEDLIEAVNNNKSSATSPDSSPDFTTSGGWWKKTKDLATKGKDLVTSGAGKIRNLLPSAGTIAAVANTPVTIAGLGTAAGAAAALGTGAVGLGLGYGIGKLIQPGIEKLQEIYDDRRDNSDKKLALLKSGKVLIDKQKEWLATTPDKDGKRLRPNGEEATLSTAARDVDKYLQESMIRNKASDSEIKEFKEYAMKQLGGDIFTVKKAPPTSPINLPKEKAKSKENKSSTDTPAPETPNLERKSSTANLTQQTANQATKIDQSVLNAKKTEDIILKPVSPASSTILPNITPKDNKDREETQLNLNQPLSINFNPLVDRLSLSFNGIGKTVESISNKLDILTRVMSNSKEVSPAVISPPASSNSSSASTSGDSKNNIAIYRGDYNNFTRNTTIV